MARAIACVCPTCRRHAKRELDERFDDVILSSWTIRELRALLGLSALEERLRTRNGVTEDDVTCPS